MTTRKWQYVLVCILALAAVATVDFWAWAKKAEANLASTQYVVLAARLQAKVNVLTQNTYVLSLGPPNSKYLDFAGADSNGIPIRNYPNLYEEDELFVQEYNTSVYKCLLKVKVLEK